MEYIYEHEVKYHDEPDRICLVGEMTILGRKCTVDILIGNGSFAERCRVRFDINTAATLTIGKFTSIACDSVMQLGSDLNHRARGSVYPYNLLPWDESIMPRPNLHPPHGKFDITIGSDAWIGDGAQIQAGITIGDGAIVGAGAVVTEDVPPYAVCVGNPGIVKKYRFQPGDIDFLLETRWWDMSMDAIGRLGPFLASPDIETLKRKIVLEHKGGIALQRAA